MIGRRALDGDTAVLGLVPHIRDQPVAMALFSVGLVLLALASVLAALAWQRSGRGLAAWPLGVVGALFLAQFFLPPEGRMAYGVLYAVAAGVWLVSALREGQTSPSTYARIRRRRADGRVAPD